MNWTTFLSFALNTSTTRRTTAAMLRFNGIPFASLVLALLTGGCSSDDDPASSADDDTEMDASADDDSDGSDASTADDDVSPANDDIGDDDDDLAGETVTETIDADEGGSIQSADGVFTLVIPPDSIDEDTEISIRIVPEADWSEDVRERPPIGNIYDVQPDGLQFAVPAEARFEWEETPDELTPDEGEGTELGEIYSLSGDGEVEAVPLLAMHFLGEDSSGVRLAGEVEHLSIKWVTRRTGACTVTMAADVGEHYVGTSWTATAFDFSCSGGSDAITRVSPLASSSNTSVVSVAFPSSMENDRLLTEFSNNFWRPGAGEDVDGDILPLMLERPTWACVAVGDATIAGGVILERGGRTVAVTKEIGPESCVACELSQEDCENLEEFNLEACACECPDEVQCEPYERFDRETCDCVCIQQSCPGDNQTLNPDTCDCDCNLTQEDCSSVQTLNTESCECECRQLQNCSGAFPTWNPETCECECTVTQGDCTPPHTYFYESSCSCGCPPETEENACSDLEYYDGNTCQCVCPEEDIAEFPGYCAQFNKRFDEAECDCVCDLDPETCTGNTFFHDTTCRCYCPLDGEGDFSRDCANGYLFDEEACDCVCDLSRECPPDFALNPETCECECILDQEASCFSSQILNQETCECECPDAPNCEAPHELNPETCECECDPDLIAYECGPAEVRNPETCLCECNQTSSCPAEMPHYDDILCECTCDRDQVECAPPTPYFNPAICGCGAHAFYMLEDRIIMISSGCGDADGQIRIENVTENGFTVTGLGTNGPIQFNITGPLTATGGGIVLFGQGGHNGSISFSAMITEDSGSGTFFGSQPGGGSCTSSLSYTR